MHIVFTYCFIPLELCFCHLWFKQIQSLFNCCWGSKVAELISLKFTVQFAHRPRFTFLFNSTILSLSLAFYKGSNFVLRKQKWSKWMKFKFDLNRCFGTCQKALQFENSHFSFKMKNFVCFWNFSENAIFLNIDKKMHILYI